MKSCYIAAPFIYGTEQSLNHDIRALALGDVRKLLYPSTDSVIRFQNTAYRYVGPFWYEETDDGGFTDCDSSAVVKREKTLIDQADLFIAIFDGTYAPGTATELTYAATTGKEIAVFYLKGQSEESDFPSICWYPIVFAKTINPDARIIRVTDISQAAQYFGVECDVDYTALLSESCRQKKLHC